MAVSPPNTQSADRPADRAGAATTSGRGLTDDVLTLAPRSRSVAAYYREAVDRLAGADPGLAQLQTALQAVISIAVGVGLVDVFVDVSGALQESGPGLAVSRHNHATLIVSMLLAGIVALLAGTSVTDTSAKAQAISTVLLPAPMVAAMALGLALGSYRLVSLAYLVVLMSAAVYVRRWGPRGSAAGIVAFNAGFLGFFLHTELALRDIGWLTIDLLIGAAASLLVRFALFRPDPERTLRRMRRSWQARTNRLLTLSIAVLDSGAAREREALSAQLRRQLVRLNESTLMIDAQLVESAPRSAAAQAQRLFDVELAVSNCARFAGALADVGADSSIRQAGRRALATVLVDEPDGRSDGKPNGGPSHGADGGQDDADAPTRESEQVAALHRLSGGTERVTLIIRRLAASITDYANARRSLDAAAADLFVETPPVMFTPAVGLNGGFLPGSVLVSTAASTTVGRGGRLDQVALPTHLRTTIQVAVAASLAVVVGDIVSGSRLYWAVLATFLAFLATTNSGEQIRKAFFRVAGTAIGIVLGDLLVHLTGGHIWSSLLIVLVALFFGVYLIRINYTFMVIGITVTMSQLYAQLGEFSWDLLVLRLGETAIGVGAVIITVAVIVPLRPQRVLITAVLLWFQALRRVLEDSLDRLQSGPESEARSDLRPAVRNLDAAYAALEATAVPLRSATFGRNSAQLREIRVVSAAARSYARSLAVKAQDAQTPVLVPAAASQLRQSIDAIEHRISSGEHGCYVRSSALLERASRADLDDESPQRLALRDLTLLDGALARLAAALQMEVGDHDTAPEVAGH